MGNLCSGGTEKPEKKNQHKDKAPVTNTATTPSKATPSSKAAAQSEPDGADSRLTLKEATAETGM